MANMANYVLPAPTAWGNLRMYYAPADEETGAMPAFADLLSVGYVLEDSISTDIEEGDVRQLFEEGHILRDELRLDSTLTINFTIIGIPSAIATAFWDATVTGTGPTEIIQVNSLTNTNKYAIRLDAPATNSQALEAPFCTINMTPIISSEQGWTAECSATIIAGPANYTFRIVRMTEDRTVG